MFKIIFSIFFAAFSSAAFAATEYRDGSVLVSLDQISLSGINSSESIQLGPYQAGSIQCVWASITGADASYALQFSNDGVSWDEVSGATKTTSGAAGSGMWVIDPIVAKLARVRVSAASTTGTLNCFAVLKKF